MRIAIIGTRGVPANYGGFETFARELGTRLVARGHDVTVYCRANYVDPQLKQFAGMNLVVLPVVRQKYAETVVHTAISVVHAAIKGGFDVCLVCNSANAVFCWVPRLAGQKVVLNVDGMEWRRKKWNAAGRAWYRAGAYLSTIAPNRIVTDAAVIHDYYRERFGAESRMIAYGAAEDWEIASDPVRQIGLDPGNYFLYVSRLEPENNAHLVLEAYARSRPGKQLALVGSAPYAPGYVSRLKQQAEGNPKVIMPGGIYGDGYRALQAHAGAYIHATEVGGTHPALVEAMAAGNCVLAYATPENREVIGDVGMLWHNSNELAELMALVDRDRELAENFGKKAAEAAKKRFSWERITQQYEELFQELIAD